MPPTLKVADVLRLTGPKEGLLGSEIAVGEGSLWVPLHGPRGFEDPASILRIDPTTNEVVAEIPVPAGPVDLSAAAGSVWMVGYGKGTGHIVSRIDATSNRVVATVPLPEGASGGPIVATDDAVWVGAAGATSRELLRLDPGTGEVVDRVPADFCSPFNSSCSPNDEMIVGEGALWVAGQRPGIVIRLDLATSPTASPFQLSAWIVATWREGSAWVARLMPGDEEDRYYGDPRLLVRIDAGTGEVVGRPVPLEGGQPDPLGGASGPFATGDGGVWLIGDDREGRLAVAWLDSHTLRVERSVALTEWPCTDAVLDADAGAIWVSHAYSVTRLDVRS